MGGCRGSLAGGVETAFDLRPSTREPAVAVAVQLLHRRPGCSAAVEAVSPAPAGERGLDQRVAGGFGPPIRDLQVRHHRLHTRPTSSSPILSRSASPSRHVLRSGRAVRDAPTKQSRSAFSSRRAGRRARAQPHVEARPQAAQVRDGGLARCLGARRRRCCHGHVLASGVVAKAGQRAVEGGRGRGAPVTSSPAPRRSCPPRRRRPSRRGSAPNTLGLAQPCRNSGAVLRLRARHVGTVQGSAPLRLFRVSAPLMVTATRGLR